MNASDMLRITQDAAVRIEAERTATADRERIKRENNEKVALDSAIAQILNYANAGCRTARIGATHATVGYLRRALADRAYTVDAYTKPDDRGFGFVSLTVRW